jgi:hypothetical protein
MTSISNLFSNFDDLTKKKSVTDSATAYTKHKYTSNASTPALTQGERFKTYQKKIKKNLVRNAQKLSGKEGFLGIDLSQLNLTPDGLTKQSEKIIKNNSYSSQDQTISNLQQQYQSTLTQYNKLLAEISGTATGYVNRVNPNNPYLGKTVSFTTGQLCYVTQQGVVKWYPNPDILTATAGLNGCPSFSNIMPINLPWLPEYNTPGATIPTNPPLVSGTPMTAGQSCGNEGINIYVDEILNNPSATYQGCYADNTKTPLMKFIGDTPPPPSGNLQNGSFDQPQIANNSYQYINSNSTVIGWDFYAVLINNSDAWGYPMPYPAGNQAACIQATQIFGQWINLNAGTYDVTFYACGRPNYSGANTISVYCAQNGNPAETVLTFTPSTTAWQQYTATLNLSTSGNIALGFQGLNPDPNNSTAIQNVILTPSGVTSKGAYTYDMCQQTAIDNEYQYFALQDVNPATSQGYCAVSNDLPTITNLGNATVPSQQTPLWSSDTQGQTGNTATLTVTGTLSVYNSSGAAVYATQSPPNTSYVGCYGDTSTRAMQNTSNNQWLPFSQCQQLAQDGGFSYFATQAEGPPYAGDGSGWCAASNDLSQATEYGVATNCTQNNGIWMGGGWSNAIYSLNNNANFCLILLDSGNMIIQRGTSPSDNQGIVWQTNTTANQPNPQYAAANGTYGQNWITQGSTLAAGDWVGSPNGYIALMMQQDGNLVLYTFSTVTNCQKMNDGNTGGGAGANALYNIGQVGVAANMGKLAYIDQNSELHVYPSTNIQFTTSYTKFANTNITPPANNIPGTAYSNATVEQCQTTCNNIADCGGFAFQNNTCYPVSEMYPNGPKMNSPGTDLYMRNTKPLSPPVGVTNKTKNTDSVTYTNYVSGGHLASQYGLANATSVQQQQLSQLQTQMDLLTNQITNLTSELGDGTQITTSQMKQNVQGVEDYLTDLNNTKTKIQNFNTTSDNILKDSDIVVLQKNYDYLFWSILAAGSVLVAMNVVNK